MEVPEDHPLDVGRSHPADRFGIVGVPLPVGDGDRLRERGGDLIGRIAIEDDLGLDLGPRLLALRRARENSDLGPSTQF